MLVIATIAVALLLTGVGVAAERVAFGPRKSDMVRPVYALGTGWAFITLLSVVCTLVGLGLFVPIAVVGVVGITGLALQLRRVEAGALLFAWLLVSPLVLVTASIPPTMYDEFSHWLPNTRFLVEENRFPDALSPNVWSAAPGYPPALALVGYLVEQFSNAGYERAGKIFNVLIAAAFGLLLAERIRSWTWVNAVGTIAVGVAAATVLNPFFDPRVALTVYPDLASGAMLALCVSACWQSLKGGNPIWLFRAATTAVVLVLLRESNVAFLAGLGGGLALMGSRARSTLAALLAPALAAFALWRVYLWLAAIPPVLVVRPVADWNWLAPITVVSVLVTDRLAANPLLGFAAFALAGMLVALAARSLRRRHHCRTLLFLCGTVAVVWLLFLAASYVAVLPLVVAVEAHSTWRYITQLGPTLTFALFALAGANAPTTVREAIGPGGTSDRRSLHRLAIAMIVCVAPGAFTFATWRYWKIDCRYPDLRVTRLMALSMPQVEEIGVIYVRTAADAGWDAGAIQYYLHRRFGTMRQTFSLSGISNEGYLLDLHELVPERLRQASYAPTVSLFHWNNLEWEPLVRRLFKPEEYACTPW